MKTIRKGPLSFVVFFAAVFIATAIPVAYVDDAYAQSMHHKRQHKHHRATHSAYTTPHSSSFIIDAESGQVLESENPDALRYPASLTKMMTLYLTFEALNKGMLKLDDPIVVSEHAASMPQTNIAMNPGDRLTVREAILSIVVRSANDSAVALGETLGGTEPEFAQRMTRKAAQLGMKNTYFHNASGLPDPVQHTTARDMAMLGRALRHDFPQYFPFFKTESFSYAGKTYITHNHVMTRYAGVDGIKTGYIRASGFNLVTSVNRDGHHLVAVVMGGTTWRARDDKMVSLLDKTFTQLAQLPGTNRVHLAASVANRKVSAFSAVPSDTSSEEGEGDLPIEK